LHWKLERQRVEIYLIRKTSNYAVYLHSYTQSQPTKMVQKSFHAVLILLACLAIPLSNLRAQDVKTVPFSGKGFGLRHLGNVGDFGYFTSISSGDTVFLHQVHLRRGFIIRTDTFSSVLFAPEFVGNETEVIYGSQGNTQNAFYLRYHLDTKVLDTVPMARPIGASSDDFPIIIKQLKDTPNAFLVRWGTQLYLQVGGVVATNSCSFDLDDNPYASFWTITASESAMYWYSYPQTHFIKAKIDQSGVTITDSTRNHDIPNPSFLTTVDDFVVSHNGFVYADQGGKLVLKGNLRTGVDEQLVVRGIKDDASRNVWVAMVTDQGPLPTAWHKKVTYDVSHFQLLKEEFLTDFNGKAIAWDTIGAIEIGQNLNNLKIAFPCTPTIASAPPFQYSSPYDICQSSPNLLEAPPGYPDSAYYWFDGRIGRSQIFDIRLPGTILPAVSYRLMDSQGCQSKPSPEVQLRADAGSSVANLFIYQEPIGPICIGTQCVLSVVYNPGDTKRSSLVTVWANGDTASQLLVTQPGTYVCYIYNIQNCLLDSLVHTIPGSNQTAPPKPVIEVLSQSGTGVFCSNELKTIAGPVGNYSGYHWNDTGTSESRRLVTTEGAYALRVSNSAGCYSEWSEPVIIQFENAPVKPVLNRQGNTLVSPALLGNQWYFNGQILPNQTLNYLKMDQPGTYQLRIVSDYGCISDFSDPVAH
jgi:hypothetical protein